MLVEDWRLQSYAPPVKNFWLRHWTDSMLDKYHKNKAFSMSKCIRRYV